MKIPWNIKKSSKVIQSKAKRYLLDVAHFTRNHTIKKGKILSLHLSSVVCISKGKLNKDYEFGRQIQLGRIGGNFMVPLSNEVKMEDKKTLVSMVENHSQIFGQDSLGELRTDKGYYSESRSSTWGSPRFFPDKE